MARPNPNVPGTTAWHFRELENALRDLGISALEAVRNLVDSARGGLKAK